MLKFVKSHMDSIDGIELYPLIGLLIFVPFFVYLIWTVIRASKPYIQQMSEMPLEQDLIEEQPQNSKPC